jgi:hypothetical protein
MPKRASARMVARTETLDEPWTIGAPQLGHNRPASAGLIWRDVRMLLQHAVEPIAQRDQVVPRHSGPPLRPQHLHHVRLLDCERIYSESRPVVKRAETWCFVFHLVTAFPGLQAGFPTPLQPGDRCAQRSRGLGKAAQSHRGCSRRGHVGFYTAAARSSVGRSGWRLRTSISPCPPYCWKRSHGGQPFRRKRR